ncbi:SDR family NAD(P)-dependent oxidoreductase [Alicyclobacillaceae bacterium I2511]|nr:SDR family NAD(P)-dependent oxidoreductase [Alicyclobacillaceae bacterium I2511]
MQMNWTTASIPDLQTKRVLITGANSGIGWAAAKTLAEKGAEVILAVRNPVKGEQAAAMIKNAHKDAIVSVMELDLSNLEHIRRFADAYLSSTSILNILINNAGVMAPPYRRTKDGFEMQFGVNYLGHFALTGLLLPALYATPEARVVIVSSLAHERGTINFEDLNSTRQYRRWVAYSQSKLANLLFAYELQRRLLAAETDVKAIACHPGIAATNIIASSLPSPLTWLGKVLDPFIRIYGQDAHMGALPTLYAATSPTLTGGEYIGPHKTKSGYPMIVDSSPEAKNIAIAKRLWKVSEQMTKVQFGI